MMLQLNLFGDEPESTPENSPCYREVSPVSLTALRENVKRLLMSVICGENSQGSYASLDRSGCWVKTSGGCYQVKMDGSTEEYCVTWTKWGIMSGGAVTELRTLERYTNGRECSLLPTPTARDWKSPDMNPESKRFMQKTELNTAVMMFPTPCASDAKNGGANSTYGNGSPHLSKAAATFPTPTTGAGLSQGNCGQLNPTWVEWLMGFPIGWTELDVSETP